MTPYELGVSLAKMANIPMQGGLNMGILGNVPKLQMRTQTAPIAPQAVHPGSIPNAPLMAGAAQPAIQAQAPGANQAAPAGGGTPMQQLPQNPASSMLPKRAADYQVPGQVGSFGSAVFSPESQGQRSEVPQGARSAAAPDKAKLQARKRRNSAHKY